MSVYPIASNRLRIANILEVIKESPTVKTFIFRDRLCGRAMPGQFVMVWIPGVDEVPMSLSGIGSNSICSISVHRVGEATEALHRLMKGDSFGVRGPFGRGFSFEKQKVMVVGGGTGLAPLVALTDKLVEVGADVTILFGAKTRDELLFYNRIGRTPSREVRVVAATEDGSFGFEGTVIDVAEETLEKEKFNMIYACGPEQMMYKMFLLAEKHHTPIEVSLERLMRCAIGLCGTCVIGKYRVCKDGPIFTGDQLREVKPQFGRLKRDFDGNKITI